MWVVRAADGRHWVNDRAGYRCRHGRNSAHPKTLDRPRYLYVREDTLLDELVQHLVFGDDAAPDASELVAWLQSARARSFWTITGGRTLIIPRDRARPARTASIRRVHPKPPDPVIPQT